MPHFPRFSAIALLALIWLACCPPARPAPYDMVEMTVASAPGVGTITLGTPLTPYRSLSATGAVSGELVPYHISDGANWENGRGIVNFGTNITIGRGPVSSSNGGGLITASSSAIVWVAAPAEDMVTTQYPSSVLTQVDQPICPLTDAATITSDAAICASDPTKGVGANSVTLTAPRILGVPGHLRSTGGQSITYMVTHSGSADGPTLAGGFKYPGGGQPPECNGSTVTTNCWSTGTQTDWLSCLSLDGSHIGCAPILTNMAPMSVVTGVTQFTSANTFAAATANALIGAVSVTMSVGSFTGTLAITGANSCGIVLSSPTLPSNVQAPPAGCSATGGPHSNGLYDDWNIQASQGNVFVQPEAATASTAAPVATLWSQTHKSTVITLDGTGRIATQGSSAVTHNPVYGATTVTSGKWYTQVTFASPNIGNTTVGIGNVSASTTGDYFLGADTNSVGWFGWGGTSVSGITVPAYNSGQALCVAFDVPNKLIWFSPVASPNWNNGGAAGNYPSSGAGGGSFASIAAGAIAAAGQTTATGDTATLSATPCSGLAGLSGFSPL